MKTKQLISEIKRKQNLLIKKWKTKGAYENFGQKEVGKLEDKYIDGSKYTDEMNEMRRLIQEFQNWCMSYTG